MEEKSRTQIKNDAKALKKLGERLVSLPLHQLEGLDLPEELFEAIKFAQSITKHGAIRRQIQYIGGLMREFDSEPIRQVFNEIDDAGHQAAMEFKQIEHIRDDLVSGNDDLIEELIERHPRIERQRLTQLTRAARKERSLEKPAKSGRALFRYLKEEITAT